MGASGDRQPTASALTPEGNPILNVIRTVVTTALVFVAAMPLSASGEFFPKPVASVLPEYPEDARSARVAGTVKLWFTLKANGEVAEAGVVSGNPLLRDAAVSTVKSWRFDPKALPANVRFETEFVYVLGVQPREGEPKLAVSLRDFRHVEIVSERYVKPIE
jgi:TonB family protein